MQRMKARLPPRAEIREALSAFFVQKKLNSTGITDTHARLAVQALRYLSDAVESGAEDESAKEMITTPTTTMASKCFQYGFPSPTSTPTASHLELARMLYDISKSQGRLSRESATFALVYTLSSSGRAFEAWDLTLAYEQSHPKAQSESAQDTTETTPLAVPGATRMWQAILDGMAKADNELKLQEVLDIMQARGMLPHALVCTSMMEFYIRRNNLDAVKTWYQEAWSLHEALPNGSHQIGKQSRLVLDWCLSKNHLEFGHEVVRMTTVGSPPKDVWDAIFVWAAGTGKGADEIGRMFTVMESSNKSIADRDQWRTPDISTINSLVELATSRNDPYLAERFISLGHQKGIQPDALTYVLQMEYRLSVSDVDGALTAYANLQSMDLSDNRDVPASNKLLVALCDSKRHDFDTVMNVVADLADRRVRFEPLTVTKLALLHLSRDELPDTTDLLNTHAFHYSSAEREGIRNAIFDFALDPKTPVSRSWDAYTVLDDIFDEMPRPQRTSFMTHFFHKGRSDMAVHVFTGMRRHSRPDTISNYETYATAFLDCAKIRDVDSLEVIHNQLKIDYTVDVSTYLYNTLMIGYIACDKGRKALTFWDDIAASREGPTYNSIHIALRACEKSPFGDLKAQEIWQRLRKQKVDLDQALWSSYAAALAGNGDNELAISTIEEAEAKNEVDIDPFLVGSLLTGCPGQGKQAEIEAWAKDKYPHVWASLENIGFDVNEIGMRAAKIDRRVTP